MLEFQSSRRRPSPSPTRKELQLLKRKGCKAQELNTWNSSPATFPIFVFLLKGENSMGNRALPAVLGCSAPYPTVRCALSPGGTTGSAVVKTDGSPLGPAGLNSWVGVMLLVQELRQLMAFFV